AAAKRLKELRERTARCCCRFCGSSLEIRKIVFTGYDSRIELFCSECNQIEYGTEPELYLSAKYFVETMEFNYYPDLDDNVQTKKMNIAKVCDIMAWQNKHMGFLNADGFAVPVELNPSILGNMLVVNESELQERLEEQQTLKNINLAEES
ncbi:MAG: hypothetical protein IJ936_02725, partial [Peptococcaceae bacterium]|nr:hypothetical protein [Peptococcaceae bacterium]